LIFEDTVGAGTWRCICEAFSVTSTVPTGFNEIQSTYKDRLIKLGGTALSTGGSVTHNHTGSISSISSVASDYTTTGITDLDLLVGSSHSHNSGTVGTVSGVSTYPIYTQIRMIYRNVSGWNGLVPTNGAICKETLASGWSTLNYTDFVVVASASGTNYPQDAHSHNVNVTLGTPSISTGVAGNTGTTYSHRSHGHNLSSTALSVVATYDYYYAAIRFIYTPNSDQYVMKDGICFLMATQETIGQE